jgi:hypothetical protein
MKFAVDYFEIGPHKIEWGKTVNEINEMARDCVIKKSYPNGIHYGVSGVLGLKAVSVIVEAASQDRPAHKVCYRFGADAQPNEYYLETLNKILNKPDRESLGGETSGFIWDLPEAHINLVTYSAKYMEKMKRGRIDRLDGKFSAWMRITLSPDTIARIIKPWRIKKQGLETKISGNSKGSRLFIFTLHEKQRPIYHDGEGCDPMNPFSERRLSAVELWHPEVVRTPEHLHAQLKSNEIAMCKIAKLNKWAVCNKWDLILLDHNKKVTYEQDYYGGLCLRVDGFKIEDYRGDDLMSLIVKKLEKITGHEINKYHSPDTH